MPLDEWFGRLFGFKTEEKTFEYPDLSQNDYSKPDIRDYLSYDLAAAYDECLDFLMGFRPEKKAEGWTRDNVEAYLEELYIIAQRNGWRG